MEQTKQQFQARQNDYRLIPISEIDDNCEFNCRGKINPADVEYLAKDISVKGLMQPPMVRPMINGNFKYRVVAGFSRMMALRILRWKEIPVVIRECTDEEASFLNLTENLQRTDLNFIQEAEAVRTIGIRYPALDDEMIGQRLGQSRDWVKVRLFALSFPEDIKEVIAKGWMSQVQIKYCYSLRTKDEQYDFVRRIKEARERGLQVPIKAKKARISSIPKESRTRVDIFAMQNHIVSSLKTNNFGTRCLAWAAGEISDRELFGDIENIAEAEEIPYKMPSKLNPTPLEEAIFGAQNEPS